MGLTGDSTLPTGLFFGCHGAAGAGLGDASAPELTRSDRKLSLVCVRSLPLLGRQRSDSHIPTTPNSWAPSFPRGEAALVLLGCDAQTQLPGDSDESDGETGMEKKGWKKRGTGK